MAWSKRKSIRKHIKTRQPREYPRVSNMVLTTNTAGLMFAFYHKIPVALFKSDLLEKEVVIEPVFMPFNVSTHSPMLRDALIFRMSLYGQFLGTFDRIFFDTLQKVQLIQNVDSVTYDVRGGFYVFGPVDISTAERHLNGYYAKSDILLPKTSVSYVYIVPEQYWSTYEQADIQLKTSKDGKQKFLVIDHMFKHDQFVETPGIFQLNHLGMTEGLIPHDIIYHEEHETFKCKKFKFQEQVVSKKWKKLNTFTLPQELLS